MCGAASRPSRRSPSSSAAPSAATSTPTTSTRTTRSGPRSSASTSRRGCPRPPRACRRRALAGRTADHSAGVVQTTWRACTSAPPPVRQLDRAAAYSILATGLRHERRGMLHKHRCCPRIQAYALLSGLPTLDPSPAPLSHAASAASPGCRGCARVVTGARARRRRGWPRRATACRRAWWSQARTGASASGSCCASRARCCGGAPLARPALPPNP